MFIIFAVPSGRAKKGRGKMILEGIKKIKN